MAQSNQEEIVSLSETEIELLRNNAIKKPSGQMG